MGLVTVIGAMNQNFAVTVDGTRTYTLQQRYHSAVSGVSQFSTSVEGGELQRGGDTLSGSIPSHEQSPPVSALTGNQFQPTISAVGDLNVPPQEAGGKITVGGTLTFVGGVEHPEQKVAVPLAASRASLYGASAGHPSSRTADHQGHIAAVPPDASKAHAAFTVWNDRTDEKRDSGKDHSGIDTLSGGKDGHQSQNATVSGSTGLLDFIDGQDGRYVIEDFGRTAGNKVALHGVSHAQLEKMLSQKTVSGGNTVVTMPDKTQVTFIDDHSISGKDFTLL